MQPYRPKVTRRRIAVPDPAVGAEWVQANDTGRLWLVRAVTHRFVTSAVVATRASGIQAFAAEDVWFRATSASNQLASLTRNYHAYCGSGASADSTLAIRIDWPTDGLWLQPGEAIGSTTANGDPGDQYSRVLLDVVEYSVELPTGLIPAPYEHLYELES